MRWILLAVVLLASLSLQAQQNVFRWTDENGRVHYGAKPPVGVTAESIRMRSPEPEREIGRGEVNREQMRQRVLRSFEREREIKQEKAAKQAAEERRKALRCKQMQRAWKNLTYYGPVYYENQAGGRKFLNEEEREGEKRKLRKQMKGVCKQLPD